MLTQVTLEIRAENRLQDIAREHAVNLAINDCKSFNRTGMTLLAGIRGDPERVRGAIAQIKKARGIRQAIEGETAGDSTPLLLVIDRPGICRASNDAAIVCLDCPLNSETQASTWRFLVRKNSDFRRILSGLGREGIQARIEDVAPMDHKATLTGRQKEIIATAVVQGYFEFPRRTSLTVLSRLVGVKPSTLSEILRSAERRIMESAVGVPSSDN
jgi:predicted DNA binding protein